MNVTIQEQDGNMVAILEGNLNTAVAAATEKVRQSHLLHYYHYQKQLMSLHSTYMIHTP